MPPTADHARGGRELRHLLLRGWKLRGHRVPRRASGPAVGQLLPRHQQHHQLHDRPAAAEPVVDLGSGGHGTGVTDQAARRPRRSRHWGSTWRAWAMLRRSGRGRDGRLLRRQHAERSGRRPDGGAVDLGAAIMAQDASEVPAGANVTVVTGTDFAVATPAPATTATTATTARAARPPPRPWRPRPPPRPRPPLPPPPRRSSARPRPRPRHSPRGIEVLHAERR